MIRSFVAGALALSACVMPVDDELDGALADQAQAVFGGQVVSAGELPGVVALVINDAEVCSGALVHAQWVVTAAHCVAGKAPSQVRVVFDRLDLKTSTGSTVGVKAIEVNARYDAQKFGDNDIALVKLVASQPSRPRLLMARFIPPPLSQVTIAGYGAVTAPSTGTGVLRKLVTASASCASVGATASDANVMCFDANDGNGTCFGDSGGPVLLPNGALVGVTSFGANTTCTGYHAATLIAGEQTFLDPLLSKPADDAGGGDDTGGCSAGRGAASGWLVALALLGFALRRAARRSPAPTC